MNPHCHLHSLNPLPHGTGLYVHVPFCLSRCGYCSFVSSEYDADAADAYLTAVENEYALRRPGIFGADRRPSTLFLGGGTPSCLSVPQLTRLLRLLPFPAPGNEATCEINPDCASGAILETLLSHGISRCSFGVQTFSAAGLRILGRRHTAAAARESVLRAVNGGFHSVSLDLIMGWPGQTPANLLEDLNQAADLGVTHLSCYQLILEEECRSYRQLTAASEGRDDEAERELWETLEEAAEKRGFEHYETSNFARPGYQCRHNTDTWQGRDYLGLGAGAHSHLQGTRSANTGDISRYTAALGDPEQVTEFTEMLPPEEKARECAVFWLRLFAGINSAEFEKRTGYDIFTLCGRALERFITDGIMEIYHNKGIQYLRVVRQYQPVLDAVLEDLV